MAQSCRNECPLACTQPGVATAGYEAAVRAGAALAVEAAALERGVGVEAWAVRAQAEEESEEAGGWVVVARETEVGGWGEEVTGWGARGWEAGTA